MAALVADPDHILVSSDASAGEPSVTAHFSGDKNYRWATLDGIGKEPRYVNNVLMIDDVYLMTASAAPMFATAIRDAFNRDWGGRTFQEQWLHDADVIKSALKKIRQISKILCLGISYGMQPKKMVKQMYEQGVSISLQEATEFFNAYWTLFNGVRRFSDKLKTQMQYDGFIINPFGYRLSPEPRLAFNYFIQSSVSGLMHVYLMKLMAIAPYADFVTVIHDELILQVHKDRLEDLRGAVIAATQSLNDDLKWSVNMRMGFVAGENMYTAK